MVDIALRATGLYPDRTICGIDPNSLHPRKIDDQSVVAWSEASAVMAAAAHREQKLIFTRKIDWRDNIRDIGTSNDEPRTPINHCVIQLARFIVTIVGRLNEFTAKTLGKILNEFSCFHCIPVLSFKEALKSAKALS
jgi:hypothetical protein